MLRCKTIIFLTHNFSWQQTEHFLNFRIAQMVIFAGIAKNYLSANDAAFEVFSTNGEVKVFSPESVRISKSCEGWGCLCTIRFKINRLILNSLRTLQKEELALWPTRNTL